MKTIQVVLLLCVLITGSVSAQTDTMKASPEKAHVFFATAKFEYTSNLHELEGMSTLNLRIASEVSPNILKSFFTTFHQANDDKWFFYDKREKIYLVKFNSEEKLYKALLNRKGKVFYTMIDGSEKDLSNQSKKNIKAWFKDYNIVGLVHVNTNNKNEAMINLRHKDDLIVVSVDDDVVNEVGRYKLYDGYIRPTNRQGKIIL